MNFSVTQYRWLGILAVTLAAITVIVLAERLRQSNDAVHALQTANSSMLNTQRHDRQVLEELCSTNSVISGLVRQTIVLFRQDLQSGTLPAEVRSVYRQSLETFKGYDVVLNQQTACNKVTHP